MDVANSVLPYGLNHILIIDDHRLFLESFSLFLKHNYSCGSVLTADNAEKAFAILEKYSEVSLILLDLDMPGISGHDFMLEFKKKKRVIPVVALSSSTSLVEIRQILELGSMGFIPKSYSAKRMCGGLNRILMGDVYVPDDIKDKLNCSSKIRVTKRQAQILKLVSEGLSNKQIAYTLHISEPTVKFHVSNLFDTFKTHNRMDCVRNARELGFLR